MMRAFINRYFFAAKKSLLDSIHIKNKAKMVEFAGYDMPVHYPTGIIKQHLHCRQHASLFDVSHMGQVLITGPQRKELIQKITVGNTNRRVYKDIKESYLTVLLNEDAGIIDDAIVAIDIKNQQIVMVINAGNKYTDMQHIQKVIRQNNFSVNVKLCEDLALIALQGPKSVSVLQKLTDYNLTDVPFMGRFRTNIGGAISRSGYTGQDGFQISGSASQINNIVQILLKDSEVQLAGLGCRDSLRVEAGLCLHGHEISEKISPFESGLMWTIYKKGVGDGRVRYIGQNALEKIVEENKLGKRRDRKRVGFILDGPGIVRENCRIFNEKGEEIGKTSSGVYSPVLKKGVGMAYVDQQFLKNGTKLLAQQRQIRHPLTIVKLPIIPSKYYKGWNDFPK